MLKFVIIILFLTDNMKCLFDRSYNLSEEFPYINELKGSCDYVTYEMFENYLTRIKGHSVEQCIRVCNAVCFFYELLKDVKEGNESIYYDGLCKEKYILTLNEACYIGLIGPGGGFLTRCLETFFPYIILEKHAFLHDVYGMLLRKTQKDLYALGCKWIPRFIRNSPLIGHVSGIIWCKMKFETCLCFRCLND